jgi:hypothetical protein
MLTYVDQPREECELNLQTPNGEGLAGRGATAEMAETILRDIGFVLHLTRQVHGQIRRDRKVC